MPTHTVMGIVVAELLHCTHMHELGLCDRHWCPYVCVRLYVCVFM